MQQAFERTGKETLAPRSSVSLDRTCLLEFFMAAGRSRDIGTARSSLKSWPQSWSSQPAQWDMLLFWRWVQMSKRTCIVA
eukprot:1039533-Pelagomonas_calceolata.AAC.2